MLYRVSSSYFFLFFEHIPIFSYFLDKISYFSYFLACKAKMWYKIKNEIILLCALEIDLMQNWQQNDLDALN